MTFAMQKVAFGKTQAKSFEAEKDFEVKFEGSHGGTWILVIERTQGYVFSVGFGKEMVWLSVQLKKVVEMEVSLGFI